MGNQLGRHHQSRNGPRSDVVGRRAEEGQDRFEGVASGVVNHIFHFADTHVHPDADDGAWSVVSRWHRWCVTGLSIALFFCELLVVQSIAEQRKGHGSVQCDLLHLDVFVLVCRT